MTMVATVAVVCGGEDCLSTCGKQLVVHSLFAAEPETKP
jgi:hypothetical protein